MEFVATAQAHVDEYDAARIIADTLREQAARMPLDSELRGLALRGASRWQTIAGCKPVRLDLVATEMEG